MTNLNALELAIDLYRECEKLKVGNPLKDQILRAAVVIPRYIVDGSGHLSLKDRKRYYSVALDTVRETQALVKSVNNQKLIDDYSKLDELVSELVREPMAVDIR
jgi:four helix bundle protein